jgi:hypothetical protein
MRMTRNIEEETRLQMFPKARKFVYFSRALRMLLTLRIGPTISYIDITKAL